MKKLTIALGTLALFGLGAQAQYSPFWFDGFDTSGATTNINADIGAPRQGGSIIPTSYVTNTVDPTNDFRHQMFGLAPLQLAQVASGVSTLVSPNYSFVGAAGANIVGKRIEVVMDAYTNNGGGSYFTQSAITIGSSSPLAAAGANGDDGFSVVFLEDTFNAGTPDNFIQVWNGDTLLLNDLVNPQGAIGAFVEIFVDDLVDGNPWDGIGSTTIAVHVQGNNIGQWTIGGGGYTANYITLEGSQQFVGAGLATHVFDNLAVNSGLSTPVLVPEPSTYALLLGALSLGFIMIRRRTRQ